MSARVLAAVALAALLAAPSAAAAPASVIKPPQRYKKQVAQMRAASGIDVYLPNELRVRTSAGRVRPYARRSPGQWDLELSVGRNCWGGTRCYLASFSGTRGLEPAYSRRVKLARGRTGYWAGMSCAASCSPAVIQWQRGDVLYEIATRGLPRRSQKAGLAALANSAITAGPR